MATPSSSGSSLEFLALSWLWLAVVGVACLLTFSAQAQRPADAQPLSARALPAPVASAENTNESAVHHILTSTRYGDGYREVRHGTGFVVGRRFITVYHNIDVLRSHGSWERSIQLDGVVVEPAIVDVANDIAIFDVPDALCASWCNDGQPASISVNLEQTHPIGWYEFVSLQVPRQWRQARIVEVVFRNYRGPAADLACESDVVVAVDQPFYPGSSGGPVWDLASNRVLGMVQGSFVRESGEEVGYYKPFSCVQSLLSGRVRAETIEPQEQSQAL